MKKQMKIILAMICMSLLIGCGANKTMDQAKVTLGNYTGIEISVKQAEVTDADINNHKELILYNYNQTAESERKTVEDKDTVQVLVYIYDENGNLIEDGSSHEGFINIGSHSTYEELEQGIIGANVGDTLEIPITFPDPYEYDESLSGKQATCKVTIDYIKETKEVTLDNITDEQAKTIFGADTKNDIDKMVRNRLEKDRDDNIRLSAYNDICDYLLETCKVKPFPGLELKNRTDKYINDVKEMCNTYYNMTFEEYCKSIRHTENEYRKDVENMISETIKLELIFTAIADKEDIQYDESEFQSYLDEIIDGYQFESVEDIYTEYGEEYLKRAFRIEYVIDWLIDNADIVYKQENHNEK